MAKGEPTYSPEIARAFHEYDRQVKISNIKIGCIIGAVLMPAGIGLDYAVYPALVPSFLKVRLLCSVLIGLFWLIVASPVGQRHYRTLGVTLAMFPAASIAWMIFVKDGAESPYYAGLNLVLLVVGFVLHWTFWESFAAVSLTAFLYLVACIFSSYPIRGHGGEFFNNIYFLFTTGLIVVIGSYVHNRLRFREFALRHELDLNRQQLEESNRKLTELDQIKGRFFANISHELRTPLTLMISPLETIIARHRNTLDGDTVGLLQTMQSNGLRLLKLINDLLDLVRLDSGVMQVKREPVALDEFLHGMASAARQVADDKRIQLVVTVSPDLGLVMLDRDKLEKIVLNLQFNALKFTPPEGRVELRLDRQGEELVLKVSDTGIGIPKEKLPQMFQRFMQVDTSSRRKYQGVGIGLALVKELVEVHGGQVSVDSVEGRGSTFTVRLPYIAAPAGSVALPAMEVHAPQLTAQPAPSSSAPAQTGGTVSSQEWLSNLYHRANLFGGVVPERSSPAANDGAKKHAHTVLVADDQPDMLRFIKSELAPHYNVIEATDGQQAVDKAAASIPDIILLDMMMPEKDGIQAAREIRAAPATANVPIVLITAHVDEETKLNALRAGASDFLPKPFSTTELHVRVRNLVESHEFQRKLAEQNVKLAETIELLKATETQLVQTEKIVSLGRLSAGIIHEINNPLNFAGTALYTLRQQGERLAKEKPSELNEVIQDISDGLQRVKNIVSDLRSFTHPDATQLHHVELEEVINTALRFLSAEWKDSVTIEQSVPADLICYANRNKLLQVFVNLIQNSLDALKKRPQPSEPPKISISGHSGNGNVIINVRDNGEGIEQANIDKIFDPFFTTRDVGEGMGMGLSICYRIIQELNGQISVTSERGKFCEFRIELPAEQTQSIAV
jgi:signal transduction histidine kinase